MSFTEIVVRAGHTNAESANLLVSIRLVDLVGSQRVYYCFDRHYSVSQLSQVQCCLMFVIATLSILN